MKAALKSVLTEHGGQFVQETTIVIPTGTLKMQELSVVNLDINNTVGTVPAKIFD